MDAITLAYLAGAMDSDGSFGIKKSTYHRRVREEAHNAVYSERIMLKQVTPEIPHMLHEAFGGTLRLDKPSCKKNGRPLWNFQATDKKAAKACAQLLPYLRVKSRQAELLLELRESKNQGYWKHGYWFEKEFPNWKDLELITTSEAARMLGYTCRESVSQAITHGTLVALPYKFNGVEEPRIPRLLVEVVSQNLSKDGRARLQPPGLVKWRESLYQQIRELNKIGVNGTAVYHRTGHFQLVE